MSYVLCVDSFSPYISKGQVYRFVQYSKSKNMCSVETDYGKRWFNVQRFVEISGTSTADEFI